MPSGPSRPATPIIAVDLDDAKLEFAKKFGATHGINAGREDPIAAIHALTTRNDAYTILQQPVSHEELGRLLSTGKTALLDGFVSNKTRRKFKAFLKWDAKEGKVGFEFEPRAAKPPAKKAPARKTAG